MIVTFLLDKPSVVEALVPDLLRLRVHPVLPLRYVPHLLSPPQEIVVADLGGWSRRLALSLEAV